MGDFQDVFGTGVSAEDVIDGFCNAETRYREQEISDAEIIDHKFWFPTYEGSLAWERQHRGVLFQRYALQGGFEVSVTAARSEWIRLSEGAEVRSDPNGEEPVVEILYPRHLASKTVSHGGYTIRLATNVHSMLAAYYDRLRFLVPEGRRHLSPLILTMKEVRESFHGLSEHLSHDLEFGSGMMGIFCTDHHLLIGRRRNKKVEILPWVMEIDCSPSDTSNFCFLCRYVIGWHPDGEGGFGARLSRDTIGAQEHEGSNNHWVAKDSYIEGKWPLGLTQCLSEWFDLLYPLSSKICGECRPPISVSIKRRKLGNNRLHEWCSIAAQAIAARQIEESWVKVSCSLDGVQMDDKTVCQLWKDKGRSLSFSVSITQTDPRPQLSRRTPNLCAQDASLYDVKLPQWGDIVGYYNGEGSHKYETGIAWALCKNTDITAHKRVAALHFAQDPRAPAEIRSLVRSQTGRTVGK